MPRELLCVPYLFVIVEYKERLVGLGEVVKWSVLIFIIIIINNILIEFTHLNTCCHFPYVVILILMTTQWNILIAPSFLNMRKYVQRRRLNDLVKVTPGK